MFSVKHLGDTMQNLMRRLNDQIGNDSVKLLKLGMGNMSFGFRSFTVLQMNVQTQLSRQFCQIQLIPNLLRKFRSIFNST